MPSSKAAELLDYYEILGLEAGCSKSDVSKAYRKKSLAVHPDRYKGSDPEWAVAEFHRLVQAKEVLEDDKARAAFDARSARATRTRRSRRRRRRAAEAARGARGARGRREAPALRAERRGDGGAPAGGGGRRARRARARNRAAAAHRPPRRRRRRAARRRGVGGSAGGIIGAGAGARAAAAATPAELALRWAAEAQLSADAVRALLIELGAPEGVALAVVGHKGVAEFARAEDAQIDGPRVRAHRARRPRAGWARRPRAPPRATRRPMRAPPPTACCPRAGSCTRRPTAARTIPTWRAARRSGRGRRPKRSEGQPRTSSASRA